MTGKYTVLLEVATSEFVEKGYGFFLILMIIVAGETFFTTLR